MKAGRKKTIQPTETTNNDSLPTLPHLVEGRQINGYNPEAVKANSLRHELNETKRRITTMRSKLSTLQHIKSKHSLKQRRDQSEQARRERTRARQLSSQHFKEEFQRRQEQSSFLLKQQTQAIRDGLDHARRQALQRLLYRNMKQAEERRDSRRHHEEILSTLKEREHSANAERASRVKDYHESLHEKQREYMQSRVTLSKINYKRRVDQTLKEKESAAAQLSKLIHMEEKMMRDPDVVKSLFCEGVKMSKKETEDAYQETYEDAV